MRAIIIQDHDAANLMDQLKLEKLQIEGSHSFPFVKEGATLESIRDAMHKKFHYVVCRWLQEQGATVTRF